MKTKKFNLCTLFLIFIMVLFVGCNKVADPTSTIESNKLKNEITKIFEQTHYVNRASRMCFLIQHWKKAKIMYAWVI